MKMPPSTAAALDVGGIQFRLTSPVAVEYEFPPESYREFFNLETVDGSLEQDREIFIQPVELILDLPPLPSRLRQVTTAGPWSILGAGDTRYIVWHGMGETSPIWYARFSIQPGSSVQVFYGPERVREREEGRVILNPFAYPLDQLLTMYLLAERGGLLIHAAGLCGDGDGLICAGRSRAGKSTVSGLWLQDGRGCLSDDRIVLRPDPRGENGRWTAYGTPWPGELKVARQAHMPASALVFLQNAGDNTPRSLSPQAAFERLLPVVSLLWFDPEMLQKGLSACEALANSLPAYDFGFTRDDRAVSSLGSLLSPESRRR